MNLTGQIEDLKDSPNESIEFGLMCFAGAMNCLCTMWKDLKDEGCYFDKGVIKGARGQIEPRCPKYTPYRICEKKKS